MRVTMRDMAKALTHEAKYIANVLLAMSCAPSSVESEARAVASAFLLSFGEQVSRMGETVNTNGKGA